MKKRNTVLLPKQTKKMAVLGENIKLARLRRKLTAEQVAERAGISRRTLGSAEKGLSSVAMGIYVQVLFVLGLSDNITKVASDDKLGRKLQDIELMKAKKVMNYSTKFSNSFIEKSFFRHKYPGNQIHLLS